MLSHTRRVASQSKCEEIDSVFEAVGESGIELGCVPEIIFGDSSCPKGDALVEVTHPGAHYAFAFRQTNCP